MSIEHPGEDMANVVRKAHDKYIGRGLSTYTPTQAVIEKAKGVYLWTLDGRRLIDFASGVLVTNLGHAHKGFMKSWKEHLGKEPLSAYNMLSMTVVEASMRLVTSMKSERLTKCLWAASGAEGIQKAMWCALTRYPERPIMLATRKGYHGKKGLANDVTGDTSSNPNVRWITFPTAPEHDETFVTAELDALHAEHPGQIALLITEPYLGAAGSYHPPVWYLPAIQRWCNAHDIPFLLDEVQSCFGRTGAMYAFQKYGVDPDMVILGKGLANGEPASAIVGRADLIDALDYGQGSDTFSATPSACAAVCATLDVFKEEKIVQHAAKMAKKMEKRLHQLKNKFPIIEDVRGEGLVYGLEFRDADLANQAVLAAYEGIGKRGVHFLGPLAKKVLRVSPPLIITPDELDDATELITKAWSQL
jgi:4-aminobutyrate aminotransferase-like enzyme